MPQLDEMILQTDIPRVAHLHQYFGEWAILEEPFRAAIVRVGAIDLVAHVQTAEAQEKAAESAGSRSYPVSGGVALISVAGPMMKYASSLSGGTSTVRVRQQLRAAARDPDVMQALVIFDTPGGTVAGTQDLADEIARFGAHKPIDAYIEDCCASAGYWCAAQCRKVYANATAIVGSIGTLLVVEDYSKMAEQKGIKVYALSSGGMKGAGVAGTEITEEQLEYLQGRVDAFQTHFVKAISDGRGMSVAEVKTLADGRVHVGKDAKALGLIDGIKTLDEAIASVRTGKARAARATAETPPVTADGEPETGEDTMTTETTKPAETQPAAATIEQLEAACPGADAAFVLEQFKAKATVAQATTAYAKALKEKSDAQASEIAALKAANTKPADTAPKKPGVEALETRTSGKPADGGTASEQFWAAVKEKTDGGMAKDKAIRATVKEDPDRHTAMLAEQPQSNNRNRR